ncbi:MAG: acriflavin resistance protein [Opitutaceae bacterium]|nr:acriflavin resistance protein [Opitutaceae bacterium]
MKKDSHFAIATRRPVSVLMVVLAVCVFGYVSYQKLPLTLMPDISYPTLTVRTEYPGTAPQEVEAQISERFEQQLGVVQYLNKITSISRADQSDILLEFAWGADMSEAAQSIREKLDRLRLPRDAKRPLILRYDPTLDPIMRIGMTGPYPLDQLRLYAEEIVQRELEGEEGLAAVKVIGGLEEEYQVRISEDKLVSLNLDIQTINTRLAQNNVNLPGGRLEEGRIRYSIRTLNEFKSMQDIGSIVIAQKNGVNVQLNDIAVIERSHKDIEIETFVNGRESVEIEIYKEADANIVEAAKGVREKLYGTQKQRNYFNQDAIEAREQRRAEIRQEVRSGKMSLSQGRREAALAEREERLMTDYVAYKLPEGCELQTLTDQSVFIKQSIDEVRGNAIVGGGIAVFVIFLFLRNAGHTAIIGITIPVSILATFAPMQLSGVSLNIISLGGLALGVGMLVDNSIVVLESIFRCREEGDDFVKSTIRGVSEVGGAVVASTLTTISVFFPIVFVEGVAGQIFGDMALTVVFSLMASLIVALYFIPMLASRKFGGKSDSGAGGWKTLFSLSFLGESWRKFSTSLSDYHALIKRSFWPSRILWSLCYPLVLTILILTLPFRITMCLVGKLLAFSAFLMMLIVVALAWVGKTLLWILYPFLKLFDRVLSGLVILYRRLLDWALNNKLFIVGGAFAAFAATIIFVYPKLGSELIPKVHQGEFNFHVKLPVGTPIEETTLVAQTIEAVALESEYVDRTALLIGSDGSASAEADEGENTGTITVALIEGADEVIEMLVLEEMRDFALGIPDLEVEISYPELFSVKDPIEVEIYGHDLDDMKVASSMVVAAMNGIPGVVDVRSSIQKGSPEVQVIYDRQRLAQLGLPLRAVAELIRNKIQGQVPTEFQQRDRQIDIMVRLDEQDRMNLSDLREIVVNPRGEVPIPLSSVAELRVREGPNEIRHLDQQRGGVVSANVEEVSLSEATLMIEEALYDLELPLGFEYNVTGQAAEMKRSSDSLMFALGLAIFLVYLVMASQFESLLHPFIILFTVPLAIIGVMLALHLGGWSLNILVFIGLIMLAGIVVNNAIVLVDYINNLRRSGKEKAHAVKAACMARFRPILMTTMTTVLGLIPMALGLGEGSEMRVPLAITVIFGLTSSTFLTLVVIPSVYLLVDRKKIEVEADTEVEESGRLAEV